MIEAEPVRYELVGYGAEVVPLYDRSDEAAYLRTQVRLLADEVERLRLTDDERAVIEVCAKHYKAGSASKVLRRLLERHGGTQ